MNPKLKRRTAAGLIAVLLLVGFFAELTHRHAMPATGPTAFATQGDSPSGKLNPQQLFNVCFVCQIYSLAIESPIGFTAIVVLGNRYFSNPETAHFSLAYLFPFRRRGPPATFA